jgi:hypothetical protein
MNPMKPFEENTTFKRISAPSLDNFESENKKFEDIVIEKTSVINKKKPKLKRFSEVASASTLAGIVDRTSIPFEKAPMVIIEETEEEKIIEPKKENIIKQETGQKKAEDASKKKNLFSFDDEDDFKPKPSKPKEDKNKKVKLLFDD